MKLSLIVPCYNEEKGVENLANQLNPVLDELAKDWELELLLVDDGSKDQTLELLKHYFGKRKETRIIKHDNNKNLGEAIRTGFAHSTGDVVVTMDSDCTYDPRGIFSMLKLLDEKTDIVTASPYHPKGGIKNVPKYRLLLSRSITGIYRLLTGAKIYTFTALFRAYKKGVVKSIKFKSNNFLATAEMLVYALMKGYQVKEYPTTLSVRAFGDSKIKLLSVIWSHFKFVLKLIKMRLNGEFKKEI